MYSIFMLQKVPLQKKFFLIYNFFFARRIISHAVTFHFYCVIIPLSVFFPEISIPRWGVVYIPTAITLLNSVGTPRLGISTVIASIFLDCILNFQFLFFYWSAQREGSSGFRITVLSFFNIFFLYCSSIHLTVLWILFENVMSWHRFRAVYIGLTESERVNEWIVTEKLGDMLKTKQKANVIENFRTKFWKR